MFDLIVDGIGVFRGVDTHEYFFDHGLLIFVEGAHARLGDVPIVVDATAKSVIEREADGFALFI